MFQVLAESRQTINTVINALMLLVWTFYFQMLFNAHRRGMRPKILINRSAGQNLDAQCVISNMSAGTVYLEAVVMCLTVGDETHECSLTDLSNLVKAPEGDKRSHWFQGPLTSGEFLSLGGFDKLLENCTRQHGLDMSNVSEFDLLVVATYGPSENPAGAKRKFQLETTEAGENWWRAFANHQLRSVWSRRGLKRFLRDAPR